MRVLAIIPAFNEEDSLPALLAEVRQVKIECVVLDAVVVNDASTDATERVAQGVGAAVLSLSANLGIGGAVQTGFLYAVRNGYDAVLQIDGDGRTIRGKFRDSCSDFGRRSGLRDWFAISFLQAG